MKKIKFILLALVVGLMTTACGSSRQSQMSKKLNEMAAKPAATGVETGKALYDEASKMASWLEAHPEDSTPELLAKARDLRNRRAIETGKIVGGTVLEEIKKILGELLGVTSATGGKGGMTVGVGEILDKAVEKVLGVNDPRMKKFGPKKPGTDPLKEGASKNWP